MSTATRTRGVDDIGIAPLIAHLPTDHEPTVALCGAELRGMKAPDEADHCVVCLDLTTQPSEET